MLLHNTILAAPAFQEAARLKREVETFMMKAKSAGCTEEAAKAALDAAFDEAERSPSIRWEDALENAWKRVLYAI